jgi:hypothetical protein
VLTKINWRQKRDTIVSQDKMTADQEELKREISAIKARRSESEEIVTDITDTWMSLSIILFLSKTTSCCYLKAQCYGGLDSVSVFR